MVILKNKCPSFQVFYKLLLHFKDNEPKSRFYKNQNKLDNKSKFMLETTAAEKCTVFSCNCKSIL